MRGMHAWVLGVAAAGVCIGVRVAAAADPEVSVALEPARIVAVHGDEGKFRAHHWMNERFAGGVKEFSLRYGLPDGTELSTESHALIDENDLGASVSLKKDRVGFVDLDYSNFRKYYEGTGGVYYPFSAYRSSDSYRDLALDIGRFSLESGLTLEGLPELGFAYERELKDGVKSRLTWPAVKEGTVTRKIAPSWQEIDEIVDSFALSTHHDVAGVALHGEQRWEVARSENMREEDNLATTGVGSDTKIRYQTQEPSANLMTTTLGGERSFLEDKVFVSTGYHYAHLTNREYEALKEFASNGVLTNFSFPEQKPNNHANSDYNAHTWVGSVMAGPWKSLTVGTKLKSEVINRHSNSSYQRDFNSTLGTGPDGTIDAVDNSLTDSKAVRWGEAFSVRYAGIPRTALYTELEFEQGRVLLREDRKSMDADPTDGVDGSDPTNETFNRETVTNVRRGTWTFGGQVAPWSVLNMTAQVRHRIYNNDYDDQRETSPGSSQARSAFFDGQSIHTDDFATRATLRPCRWLRSSFRYQFREDKYATRVENEPIVKTSALSNIYTFDVMLQPLRELTTTASFSRQTALTRTPARLSTSFLLPVFHADVNTWMFSADYAPNATVNLNGSVLVSSADNFNDYTSTGMPYGAHFDRVDMTTGLTWAVNEDTSVGVDYALYSYVPSSLTEVSGYHAHVVSLEVSKKF